MRISQWVQIHSRHAKNLVHLQFTIWFHFGKSFHQVRATKMEISAASCKAYKYFKSKHRIRCTDLMSTDVDRNEEEKFAFFILYAKIENSKALRISSSCQLHSTLAKHAQVMWMKNPFSLRHVSCQIFIGRKKIQCEKRASERKYEIYSPK